MLVREGSRGRLDALIAAARGARRPDRAGRRRSVQAGAGVEGFDEQDRPLLPPRRDLRHGGRRGGDGARPTWRARGTSIEFANSHRGRPLPPHQLDRGGRQVQGRLPARTCSTRGSSCPTPTTATKFESEKLVRERRRGPAADLPPGHRRRPLGDRRDGQDRRSLLLLQAAPEAAPRPAGVVPAGRAARASRPTSCRSTSSPRRWTTSPTWPTTSCTATPSTSSTPKPMSVGADAERVREGRARAAVRDADRREPDRTSFPQPVRAGAAWRCRPSRRSATRSARRPRHPAGVRWRTATSTHEFDARDTQRALTGTGHRGAAAVDLRGQALGLLGAQPRPGPVPRAQPGERDQGQADPDHRRLERHRARDAR